MGKFLENQLLWKLRMAPKNKINKDLMEISHKQPTHAHAHAHTHTHAHTHQMFN